DGVLRPLRAHRLDGRAHCGAAAPRPGAAPGEFGLARAAPRAVGDAAARLRSHAGPDGDRVPPALRKVPVLVLGALLLIRIPPQSTTTTRMCPGGPGPPAILVVLVSTRVRTAP